MNNRRWLLIAEYVALAASVIGSISAVIYQQVIYGLIPVCVCLLLNRLDRHRYDLWQTRQRASLQKTARAIVQLKQGLEKLEAQRLPPESDPNLLQRVDIGNMLVVVETLYQCQHALDESVKSLKLQLDMLTEQFSQRPELEQIESLTSIIVELQQLINQLESE